MKKSHRQGEYVRKRQVIPYAKINWKKATVLFQRPYISEKRRLKYPSVGQILHFLAGASENSLIFLFNAHKPGIEKVLLGEQSFESWRAKKVIKRLDDQGDVACTENPDGTTTVTITKQGFTRALRYEVDTMKLVRPKHWDKKWRVVIFDIPEKFKSTRDIFRLRLRQLGLYQLQESVYVSPFTCFDEVEFLRELYNVAFTVRYLLVEKLEDDGFLKKHFQLS